MNVLEEIEKAERHVESAKARAANINLAVGNFMRSRRIQAQKSVRRVARELGCTAPWISDLERGRRTWTPHWIARVQSVLDKAA